MPTQEIRGGTARLAAVAAPSEMARSYAHTARAVTAQLRSAAACLDATRGAPRERALVVLDAEQPRRNKHGA